MRTEGIEYVFLGRRIHLESGACRSLDPCEVSRMGAVWIDGDRIPFERKWDGLRTDAFIPVVFHSPFELAEALALRAAEAAKVIRFPTLPPPPRPSAGRSRYRARSA